MEAHQKLNIPNHVKDFAVRNKAPLIVAAIVASVFALDTFYRAGNRNHYTAGLSAMNEKKFDKAVEEFSGALRQNPSDPASRSALGWAYHSKGWVDEALKQYEMAAQSGAESLGMAYFNSGVIYYGKRKLDLAENAYLKAIQINPKLFGPAYNIGFVYADRGMYDKALTYFLKAVEIDSKSASAIYNVGMTYEKLGNNGEAKKQFERALNVDPNFSAARERLKKL